MHPLPAAACLALLAAGAPAETWEVRLGPIRAAELRLDASESAGRYEAALTLRTTGLARLAGRLRYAARASGRIDGTALRPDTYSEETDTGRRISAATLAWSGRAPRVAAYAEAGANAADGPPGAIDPLTALWTAARPVPADGACNLDLTLFDGRRTSRLTLGPPRPAPGGLTCDGAYRRLTGFTRADLAERRSFPLTLTYRIENATAHLAEARLQTLFGPARIVPAR